MTKTYATYSVKCAKASPMEKHPSTAVWNVRDLSAAEVEECRLHDLPQYEAWQEAKRKDALLASLKARFGNKK